MTSSNNKVIKVILLGDSAVGKSKLVERFLIDGFRNQQQSTFALNIFPYRAKVDGEDCEIEFWVRWAFLLSDLTAMVS